MAICHENPTWPHLASKYQISQNKEIDKQGVEWQSQEGQLIPKSLEHNIRNLAYLGLFIPFQANVCQRLIGRSGKSHSNVRNKYNKFRCLPSQF